MPTIDNLTARLATATTDTDILYIGVPGDADPDRKITLLEARKVLAQQAFILDVSRSETASVSAATDVYTFTMPCNFTITGVTATVVTAPTGADMLIDVREGATSIFDGSNIVTIDDGDSSSADSVAPAVISDGAIASGASVAVDVDQVGSSVAGAGLKVVLVGFVS